jgi:hypothetical protein
MNERTIQALKINRVHGSPSALLRQILNRKIIVNVGYLGRRRGDAQNLRIQITYRFVGGPESVGVKYSRNHGPLDGQKGGHSATALFSVATCV